MQHRSDFFYADYVLVALTDPVWLQGAFGTLTGLFNRVELWTNAGKTARTIYRLFRAAGTQSKEA